MHILLTLLEERLCFGEHSGKAVSMLWERSLLAGIELLYTARLQISICARTEEVWDRGARNSTRSHTFRASANSQRRMASSRSLTEEKQLVKAWEQSHAQQVSGTHKQQREHIWREKERRCLQGHVGMIAFTRWAHMSTAAML